MTTTTTTTITEEIKNMTLLQAEAEITRTVGEAATLFEKLEAAGKFEGNAYHFAQSLTSQARILLRMQWKK
jgi:hypothetical protein